MNTRFFNEVSSPEVLRIVARMLMLSSLGHMVPHVLASHPIPVPHSPGPPRPMPSRHELPSPGKMKSGVQKGD